MSRGILVSLCLMVLASPVVGQTNSGAEKPELIVQRFQLETARLRKNIGTITCWIRSTSMTTVKKVQATVELIGKQGASKSVSMGSFSDVPPGRVVEAKQKVKGVPTLERYRVVLRMAGRSGPQTYVYEGQKGQKQPKLVSSKGGGNSSISSGAGRSGKEYPKKLDAGLDTPFQEKNDVELGHVRFWKTGEETMVVRGGVRNGKDHAVTETTITFTLTGSGGEAVEKSLIIDRTLKSGEIHAFEQELEGVDGGEIEQYKYAFSFETDPSMTETVSMSWSDVRDELPELSKEQSNRSTGQTTNHQKPDQPSYPMLSIHGVDVVEGRESGREGVTEVYLLKLKLQVESRPVQPSGKLKFRVYEGDERQLTETHDLRPDRMQPVPDRFDLNSVEPGVSYWDQRNGVLYHALFKIRSLHSGVRLDVFIDTGQTGKWTFMDLRPPFMNSPIPPDQVR